jgi:hypothetical protein
LSRPGSLALAYAMFCARLTHAIEAVPRADAWPLHQHLSE